MLTDDPTQIINLHDAAACDRNGTGERVVSAQMDPVAMIIRCLEFQRAAINIDAPFNNPLAGAVARRQVQPLDYRTRGLVKFKTRLRTSPK